MALAQTDASNLRKPLRLWPGVVIVALQWLARFGLPAVLPETMVYGVMGGLLGGAAVVVWWLFVSRAPWVERLGAVAVMIVALAATPLILDESMATGAMGMLFYLYAIPVLSLAFVLWAWASRGLAPGPRRVAMVVTILAACAGWALVRTGGFTSDLDSDFDWRWAQTPEERLVAQGEEAPVEAAASDDGLPTPNQTQSQDQDTSGDEPPAETAGMTATAAGMAREEPTVAEPGPLSEPEPEPEPQAPVLAAVQKTPEWPGFRGPHRDSGVAGARIATDWAASPPVELWRRPIGPGWSSFAIRGERLYTQEQRGEDEVVACYDLTTGEPVWQHRDATRFWESNAGAGPRGTPTLSGDRVYTLGATGIVNALEAADGAVVWSRDAASDTGAKLPTWGFSGSPLVVGDAVLVAASGALVAYDLATGEPRWFGPAGKEGYSSPQWVTLDGVEQILQLSGDGIASVAPADGTLLWQHPWSGYPIVQPALTADGDVLLSVNVDSGLRRLAVTHDSRQEGPGTWAAEERWTSKGLKPYFNDFVVHKGHAYGFDGRILSCIELEDGARQWKGGRYGSGQLLLLPDQDVLLVLSERGGLALVAATPEAFTELARFPAIEGKTWNHPVLAGNVLLVRNGEEMAAFRLAPAGG